jgi:hypothetical protein
MYSIPEAEGPDAPQWALDHVERNEARYRTWENQGGRCCFCRQDTWMMPFTPKGKRGNMATAEHVIPKSKGGSDGYDNIVMSCYSCNAERETMDAHEYWLVWQDPYALAVFRRERQERLTASRKARNRKRRVYDARRRAAHAELRANSNLQDAEYTRALDQIDETIWLAQLHFQNNPWTFKVCVPLQSLLRSPGATVNTFLSSMLRGLVESTDAISRWLNPQPCSKLVER